MTATFVAGTLSGVEIEPNDSTAQPIVSGDSVVGTIWASTDIDWYVMTVDGGGSLNVNMTTEQSNSAYYFTFYVFDSDNNVLVSESCGSDCTSGGKNIIAGLKSAGDYYIGVISDSSFGAPPGLLHIDCGLLKSGFRWIRVRAKWYLYPSTIYILFYTDQRLNFF